MFDDIIKPRKTEEEKYHQSLPSKVNNNKGTVKPEAYPPIKGPGVNPNTRVKKAKVKIKKWFPFFREGNTHV